MSDGKHMLKCQPRYADDPYFYTIIKQTDEGIENFAAAVGIEVADMIIQADTLLTRLAKAEKLRDKLLKAVKQMRLAIVSGERPDADCSNNSDYLQRFGSAFVKYLDNIIIECENERI